MIRQNIQAHGGKLIIFEKTKITEKPHFEITLNDEQIVDLHNIANGTYSPLTGFLRKDDFLSVLVSMRLTNGIVWPIPIVLDISETDKKQIELSKQNSILLKDSSGNKLAILENIEVYSYSKKDFANYVFKTIEQDHPGVKMVYELKDYLIGGNIILLDDINLDLPKYFSPVEIRKIFQDKNWNTVVAFQTRNPPHVSHEYLQKCALEGCNGLFINPVIGKKKSGDFKDEYILGAYERLIKNYYKPDSVHLSTLPLTFKYAGPREAVLHAIIRQNFGCTHMIVGRDHAGVGSYYGTYDAQNIFNNFRDDELKIKILKYENAGFCNICNTVTTNKTCPHSDSDKMHISGTEVRRKIQNKEILPSSFMRKEISEYLIEGENQFVN
ncbi:MAG: sulfate adenylyltransferase [Candidatus Gracilibacteria bacterium]|nr:sulfate adenylyltransferase [Candidatus Gracilibacteria bacterium]